jgi:hypothetical protein
MLGESLLRSRRARIAVAAVGGMALVGILAVGLLSPGESGSGVNVQKELEDAKFMAELRRRQAAERFEDAQRELQEQRERAQAERDRLAAKQAAIDADNAKDRAWERFYTPSPGCQDKDGPGSTFCANEHVRAKTEFERKWANGELH